MSEYKKLFNGIKVPTLGLGTFNISDRKCSEIVYKAIEMGYRLIDTAASYQNEKEVGLGIKNAINDGIVKREDIFVSTKIWIHDFGDNKTERAFDRARMKLGVDYIDLCLLHYPYGDTFGAWRDLEKKYNLGDVKAIGVSNFQKDHIANLCLYNDISPMINQIEINPFCQNRDLEEYSKKKNIVVEAWSPFSMGKQNIWNNPLLKGIARKHRVSVAQIIVRWLFQNDIIAIPKASSIEHLKTNIDINEFSLSDFEVRLITMLDKNESYIFGKDMGHNASYIEKISNMYFD